jgi:hypothetical protein
VLCGIGDFRTREAAFVVSITAAGEESSAIRAMVECAVGGALKFIYQELSFYLSCMSTPPPVALTATPFCVEEMRTITPA